MLIPSKTGPQPSERGCGRRKKGAAYWVTEVGIGGSPWWKFLQDPPLALDFEAMGVSAQGLKLLPDEAGIWHAWDWIGAKFYPYFPDYVEEGLRWGFSALVPSNFDWAKITPGKSYRKAVHPKGALRNAAELWPTRLWEKCQTRQPAHTGQTEPWPADWHCISFLWEMLTGESFGTEHDPRSIKRQHPTFSYYGWTWPEGFTPDWVPAYVMRFPLSRIEIVRDPEGGRHEAQAERIDKANNALPIAIVEE